MENKQLAAIVSTRNWPGLTAELARLNNVELLSPIQNMELLKRASSRALLDVVFVDVDEFDPESNGVPFDSLGLYAVFISQKSDPAMMRKAMRHGAKDFLVTPVSKEDLSEVFSRAEENRQPPSELRDRAPEQPANSDGPAKIMTFFSTKGGAGKSTLVTNFAIALARRERKKICLLDLDLQFGDLALILNVRPAATIYDLVSSFEITPENTVAHLSKYDEEVYVLAAPAKPEQAELVNSENVSKIIEALSNKFNYIIIDTPALFHDISMAALDKSDMIYLILTPIILAVKNLKGMLDVMINSLEYESEKIKVILNRSDSKSGISAADIEKLCSRKVDMMIPSDGNIVVPSLNRGVPAIVGYPKSKFSRAINAMADTVSGAPAARAKIPFWKKLFKK